MPISGDINIPDVVVVLTSGSNWVVPDNFDNLRNFIEIIGGGGGGEGQGRGEGGGGGGYNRINDFDTEGSASIPFQLGQSGSHGSGSVRATDGTATTWHVGGEFEITAGGGSGSLTGSTVGKGSGLFDGGQGGFSAVFEAGAGGGGAGGPSGSGQAGASGDPDGPRSQEGGDGQSGATGGGEGGAGTGEDGDPGTVWTDTKTAEVAGPGGGGGGGRDEAIEDGGAGGLYGAGGGGGSTSVTPTQVGLGGDGSPGVVVITYRSTLHDISGVTLDDNKTNQQGIKLRINSMSPTLDDSKTHAAMTRIRRVAGTTLDDDQSLGDPTLDYKGMAGITLDDSIGLAKPTLTYEGMQGVVLDDAVTFANAALIHGASGITLDDAKTDGFLIRTRGFSGVTLDDNNTIGGIDLNVIKLSGVTLDDNMSSHRILDPNRDIAFFIIRDSIFVSGSTIDDSRVQVDTLHGFRFRTEDIPGVGFEVLPIIINPEVDDKILVKLSESDLRSMGQID